MSQQRSPHEMEIIFLICVGLLAAIIWAIWFFFHAELTNMLRYIRIAELWLVGLVTHKDFAMAVPGAGTQYLKVWQDWLPKTPVENIRYPEIRVTTYLAVLPLRLYFIAGLAGMMLWVLFFGHETKYRRRMNLEGLMKEQARSFPAIAPFLNFNPLDLPYRVVGEAVPAKLPLFSEALSPEEWIAYHEIKVQNNQIDLNQAWQALALQLGKRWQGPLKLSLHGQGLYAAFALRHARKRKESEALLDQLSLSWTPEGGLKPPAKVVSQIRKIIKDPKLGGAIEKYADQHAFETTALLRCLMRAREQGGVLAPASFLWLRGQDRTLWYPLNNLGRKSFHAEAVGALVHFTNELIAGQKIPTPRFEDVIKGMDAYLKSSAARPIPPLDKNATGTGFKKKKRSFFK